MKAFINREDIDFDNVESMEATQEWELIRLEREEMPEYPTKLTKFFNVRSLTLYFPENFGAETTRITYVGLKGEYTMVSLHLYQTQGLGFSFLTTLAEQRSCDYSI